VRRDGCGGMGTFMAHDFFTEQSAKGENLYLLQWILHDSSDKYALKILSALVLALRKGAIVVVSELCLPRPGEKTLFQQRSML
jgi:hypothetical protein